MVEVDIKVVLVGDSKTGKTSFSFVKIQKKIKILSPWQVITNSPF
jgi:GTPase SAR1 family protein